MVNVEDYRMHFEDLQIHQAISPDKPFYAKYWETQFQLHWRNKFTRYVSQVNIWGLDDACEIVRDKLFATGNYGRN